MITISSRPKTPSDAPWPDGATVAVRIGIHTGQPHRAQHGYTGLEVHRTARICAIASGGQVLLSRATAGIVDDEHIAGVSLRDLGEFRLKDFDRPERIFQLVIDGMPSEFAPLRGDQQSPLSGTVTIVMAEGRRMMRLRRELTREYFWELLTEYQRLLTRVLGEIGGRGIEVAGDLVSAGFATAKEAALATSAAHGGLALGCIPQRQGSVGSARGSSAARSSAMPPRAGKSSCPKRRRAFLRMGI
jgi:class 3 adenylate cyclase